MAPDMTALGIMVSAILVSRIIQERAVRKLKPEDIARLVTAFSGTRLLNLVPLAVLGAGYFWTAKHGGFLVLLGTVLIALLLMIGLQIATHRKLRALEVPVDYRRAVLMASCVGWLGIIGFVGLLWS